MFRRSFFSLRSLSHLPRFAKSDVLYNFNQSICTLALRFREFSMLKDIERFEELGINRFYYDFNNDKEVIELLKEKRNDDISKIIEKGKFAGCFIDLPLICDKDTFLQKQSVQGMMQAVALIHGLTAKKDAKQNTLDFYIGVENTTGTDQLSFDEIESIFVNFENLKTIMFNSFGFRLNFYCCQENELGSIWKQEHFLKMFGGENFGIDLNLVKNVENMDTFTEITKELMTFVYQFSQQTKALSLKDYKIVRDEYNNKTLERCDIGQGVISYSHITDIIKLSEFQGSLIFDQNEGSSLHADIEFTEKLLREQGFVRSEVSDMARREANSKNDVGSYL